MSDAKKNALAKAKARAKQASRGRHKDDGLGSIFGVPVVAIFAVAVVGIGIAVWRRSKR